MPDATARLVASPASGDDLPPPLGVAQPLALRLDGQLMERLRVVMHLGLLLYS
jgi:hypothetical protein